MKVTEHIRRLLESGHNPKELIGLGFSKTAVTRVKRLLREEKAGGQTKMPKETTQAESHGQTFLELVRDMGAIQQKLASWEHEIQRLRTRIDALETATIKLNDIKIQLEGTPALGLRRHFSCECGVSGSVAVHIKCNQCGKEAWWGWFPE